MASPSANDDRGASFTEATITLQEAIQSFQEDNDNDRSGFVLMPTDVALDDNSAPVVLGLESAGNEVQSQLREMEMQLRLLENQLRLRGLWHPPGRPSNIFTPPILDLPDLANAISLLTHLITATNPSRQLTPHILFSVYSWTWDPAWHEFYTYIPEEQTYIYLSEWKLNEARSVWEHVSKAGVTVMPDTEAEMLGAWEDWMWDADLKEWRLEIKGQRADDRASYVFPSRWRVQDDGEWVYVGRLGDVGQ